MKRIWQNNGSVVTHVIGTFLGIICISYCALRITSEVSLDFLNRTSIIIGLRPILAYYEHDT